MLSLEEEIQYVEKEYRKSLREFNEFDWEMMCYRVKLSENFIRAFQDDVNWKAVSSNQKLTESFVVEFKDKVYWSSLSVVGRFSESFLLQYKERFDWEMVSIFQHLSESFIEEYEYLLDWDGLSRKQDMSYDFLMIHFEKLGIDWYCVLNEKKQLTGDQIAAFHDMNTVHKLLFKEPR